MALAEAFDELPDLAEIVEAVYVGNHSESYEHRSCTGRYWPNGRPPSRPRPRVRGVSAADALAIRHESRTFATANTRRCLPAASKDDVCGHQRPTIALGGIDRAIEQRSGITVPSQYALLGQRYLYETDATERDLAEIAVKNHANAARNPRAQFPM